MKQLNPDVNNNNSDMEDINVSTFEEEYNTENEEDIKILIINKARQFLNNENEGDYLLYLSGNIENYHILLDKDVMLFEIINSVVSVYFEVCFKKRTESNNIDNNFYNDDIINLSKQILLIIGMLANIILFSKDEYTRNKEILIPLLFPNSFLFLLYDENPAILTNLYRLFINILSTNADILIPILIPLVESITNVLNNSLDEVLLSQSCQLMYYILIYMEKEKRKKENDINYNNIFFETIKSINFWKPLELCINIFDDIDTLYFLISSECGNHTGLEWLLMSIDLLVELQDSNDCLYIITSKQYESILSLTFSLYSINFLSLDEKFFISCFIYTLLTKKYQSFYDKCIIIEKVIVEQVDESENLLMGKIIECWEESLLHRNCDCFEAISYIIQTIIKSMKEKVENSSAFSFLSIFSNSINKVVNSKQSFIDFMLNYSQLSSVLFLLCDESTYIWTATNKLNETLNCLSIIQSIFIDDYEEISKNIKSNSTCVDMSFEENEEKENIKIILDRVYKIQILINKSIALITSDPSSH